MEAGWDPHRGPTYWEAFEPDHTIRYYGNRIDGRVRVSDKVTSQWWVTQHTGEVGGPYLGLLLAGGAGGEKKDLGSMHGSIGYEDTYNFGNGKETKGSVQLFEVGKERAEGITVGGGLYGSYDNPDMGLFFSLTFEIPKTPLSVTVGGGPTFRKNYREFMNETAASMKRALGANGIEMVIDQQPTSPSQPAGRQVSTPGWVDYKGAAPAVPSPAPAAGVTPPSPSPPSAP